MHPWNKRFDLDTNVKNHLDDFAFRGKICKRLFIGNVFTKPLCQHIINLYTYPKSKYTNQYTSINGVRPNPFTISK